MWLGELSNASFLELMEEDLQMRMLRHKERIRKMLSLMRIEVDGSPSYYVVDRLCDSLNLPVPSVKKVVEILQKNGFRASLTTFNSRGIRSDVPALRLAGMISGLKP